MTEIRKNIFGQVSPDDRLIPEGLVGQENGVSGSNVSRPLAGSGVSSYRLTPEGPVGQENGVRQSGRQKFIKAFSAP
jgi:hypothetical protein